MIRIITMILVLYFVLQLCNGETLISEINNTTVLAYVEQVHPLMDNQWMVAVEDPSAASGWAVKVKKFVTEDEAYEYFAITMLARSLPDGNSDFFYDSYMCGLFDTDTPADVLPRQIVDMIFPGRQGSCNFTEGTRAMKRSAYVTVDPEEDYHVNFPKSLPMEVLVDIKSENPGKKGSFFKVHLVIGGDLPQTTIAPETSSAPITTTVPESTSAQTTTSAPTTTTAPETTNVAPETTTVASQTASSPTMTMTPETTADPTTTSAPTAIDAPETTAEPITTSESETTSPPEQTKKSQSGYYCLDRQWNYYIIWQICTIAEFIESSIFKIGHIIVNIF